MVRIGLEPAVTSRLDAFLRSSCDASGSGHWKLYGPLNSVRLAENTAIVSAGAGFDSEYEWNFRRPTMKELAGIAWRSLRGRNDIHRTRDAYAKVWSEKPRAKHSSQAVFAENYFRYLKPSRHYLEIGAGTGYLAGMVYEAWDADVVIIDLPEIIPLSFLYLHTQFPDASFALPNESHSAKFRFLTDGKQIPDKSIDLAVNTASFHEMLNEQIAEYFCLLRRVVKPEGIFFTVNSDEKTIHGLNARFLDYHQRDEDLLFGPSPLHKITHSGIAYMRMCHLATKSD